MEAAATLNLSMYYDDHAAYYLKLENGVEYLIFNNHPAAKVENGVLHRLRTYSSLLYINRFLNECGLELVNTSEWIGMPVESDNVELTCSHCEEIIDNECIHFDEDSNIICQDCFDDDYFICNECGKIYSRIHEHWIEGENILICDDCFNENYICCDNCNECVRADRTTQVTVDGMRTEFWCPSCVGYHAWQCDECGEFFSYDVEDFDGICPDCYNSKPQKCENIKDWIAPKGVRDYNYKPYACFCPDYNKETIYYGFELECENKGEDDNSETADFVNEKLGYTYIKHDGSLDNGMEIVSHPATLEYHMSKRKIYEELFAEMRESGWRSHDTETCGLHVHISLEALEARNPFAVHNLLIMYDRFWEHLKKFSRRTDEKLDRWARRYIAKHTPYESLKDDAKDCTERYTAVNLKNPHTVEIRIFRGTLNVNTFFATLQLVSVLAEKAVELGDSAQRVNAITWEEAVRSDYKELNEYLALRGISSVREEE